MISHFFAFDVGIKIPQAQLCTSIRGCHATFLVKNTLFKGEVAWQPLKELESYSSSIFVPPTGAFNWGIACLSTIITFEDRSSYVKKCSFLARVSDSSRSPLFTFFPYCFPKFFQFSTYFYFSNLSVYFNNILHNLHQFFS